MRLAAAFKSLRGGRRGKRRKELRFQTCLRGPRGKSGAAGVEAPGAGLGLKGRAAGRWKGLSGVAPWGSAKLPVGVEGTGISRGADLGALEGPWGPGLLNARLQGGLCPSSRLAVGQHRLLPQHLSSSEAAQSPA